MLDEDGDNEENAGDGDEPEFMFQAILFVVMLVRTSVAMMVFVMMCHTFTYLFSSAKVGNSCCNSVAKCLVLGETKGEDTDADALDGG